MSKHLIYALACFVATFFFWRLGVSIWFLFLVLALYYGFLSAKPRATTEAASEIADIRYGEIDHFAVEGEQALGLYLRLAGRPVFVDIREDQLTEARKERAIQLFNAQSALDANLSTFLAGHPEFQNRYVASIGIHSPDLERAEVFWEPDGYTLLHGFAFLNG